MNTVMLANGTIFDVVDITATNAQVDGTFVKAVEMVISGASLEDIKSEFSEPTNTSSFTYVSENKTAAKTYSGYQKLRKISIDPDNISSETEEYVVVMAQTSDVKELIKAWEKTIETQDQTIVELRSTLEETKTEQDEKLSEVSTLAGEVKKTVDDHSELLTKVNETVTMLATVEEYVPATVEEAKIYRIDETKTALAEFFSNHPILSTCHDENGAYYSVTSEKQQYLSSMISIANLAALQGIEYQCSWNSVGMPCTYDWTIEQLQQLAIEIAEYVRPLVSQQQSYEAAINKLNTIEEVMAYTFTYNS